MSLFFCLFHVLASSFPVFFLGVNARIAAVQIKKTMPLFPYLQLFVSLHLGRESLDALGFLGLAGGGGGAGLRLFLGLLHQWDFPALGQHWQSAAANATEYTYSQQQTPQCTLTVSNKHHIVHLQSATNIAVYTYSQQQTLQCTLTGSNKHHSGHLQSAKNPVYTYSQQQMPQCTFTVSNKHHSVHIESVTNTTV